MISLTRIVEQSGLDGQYYDLSKDFSNFKRAIDGADEQIKNKYQQSINSQLTGKRVRARASRGYKQFEKDYEFDVSRVTIDDYYDNYVVVAHDDSGRKPKEYFLKPGVKITILSNAAGNMDAMDRQPQPLGTKISPLPPQSNGSAGGATPASKSSEPVREEEGDPVYQAYPKLEIVDDISKWLKHLMKDNRIGVEEFISGNGGWTNANGSPKVAMYDIYLPKAILKTKLTPDAMKEILNRSARDGGIFGLKEFEDSRDGYRMRIKKTMNDIAKTTKV